MVKLGLTRRVSATNGFASFRQRALKPQPPQIQLIDRRVGGPHRIVFTYLVVKELGQQNALPEVLVLDKALHPEPRLNPSGC
jgi:hypothetical protein